MSYLTTLAAAGNAKAGWMFDETSGSPADSLGAHTLTLSGTPTPLDGVGLGNGSGLTGAQAATIYNAGLATPSFVVSPTTATVGTPLTITATGTNTAWVSGTTTFAVSGGTGASISSLSILSGWAIMGVELL